MKTKGLAQFTAQTCRTGLSFKEALYKPIRLETTCDGCDFQKKHFQNSMRGPKLGFSTPSLGGKKIVHQRHDLEEQVISAVKAFAASINSGSKVVADMSLLVEVTSQLTLSNLDYWERLIRGEFSSALESTSQPKWKLWSKPSQFLTWLDLISWDGYKREKTLRTLTGGAPNSFFFALAFRRLNDWVPQVREAAKEKLPLIASASNPVHVVDALCATLSHWNSWGRIGNVEKNALLEIISSNAMGETLKLKIISSTSGPMALLFAQVGRTPVLDKFLSDVAENAVQPSVRAKAYRSQLEGKMVWVEGRKWEWTDIRYCKGGLKPIVAERTINIDAPFLEILNKSSTDRSPIVRRVAAEFLIREFDTLGEDSLRLANLFASDKSPSVAERGRFALKRFEERHL